MWSHKNPTSAASLLVLIVVVGIISFALVAGLATVWNAPSPNSVAARPYAPATQTLEATIAPSVEPTLTEAPPTETVVVFPTDPQPSPVIPPPPNTPHIPGPTAQFDQVLPIQEWSSYTEERSGLTIRYPPDWYLETSTRWRDAGATIQFFRFDPNDPILDRKGGEPIPNFVKLEIILQILNEMGFPFLPNETIEEWVTRNHTYSPDIEDQIRLIEQKNVAVDGVDGVLQVVELRKNGRYINTIIVPRGEEMIHIS